MDGYGGRISVVEAVSAWLKNCVVPPTTLIVAYSGGRDSHVLLDALVLLRTRFYPTFTLRALHVNHGIQAQAADWATHCAKVCAIYDVPFNTISLMMPIKGKESLEAQARQLRYQAFNQQIRSGEILLTAHTQTDQAETFLLQLLRGSGLAGLASVASFKKLGKGFVGRPLLTISREQIAAYAQTAKLKWIEDPSNQVLRFRRNYLRQQIIPLVQQTYPAASACIARSAHLIANAHQLLDFYLDAELKTCQGPALHTLDLTVFRTLPSLKQAPLLRYWLQQNGALCPSQKKLTALLEQMLHAKTDAQPCITWGKYRVRRYAGLLYLEEATQAMNSFSSVRWHLETPLQWATGSWQAKRVQGQGLCEKKIATGQLQVCARQGGERCQPLHASQRRPLKKCLQEYNVPPWLRYTLPLFYYDQALVGVGNLFICEGWQVSHPEEYGWIIEKVS